MELILIATFSLHLLAVNVATGAPFVAIALEWKQSRGDALAGEIGKRFVRLSLWSLALGMALGVVVLLLVVQLYPFYLQRLLNVPGLGMWLGASERLWSAVSELIVFALTMWAYLALWDRMQSGGRASRFWHRVLGLFGALNIIYHLPPLFAVVAVLTERPELAAGQPKFRELMLEPETVARVVHGWLAALAVTGVALVVCGQRLSRAGRTDDARRVMTWGARVALVPSLAQLAAGTWLTTQLPESTRQQLFGQDWMGTLLFVSALGTSLVLMHHLAAGAMGEVSGKFAARSVALVCLVVVLMVGVRHRARQHVLARLQAKGAIAAGEAIFTIPPAGFGRTPREL